MNQYIVVQSTGSDSDAAVFDLALQVARRGRTHLEFVHVSADVRDVIAAMSPGLMGDGYGLQRIADEFDEAAQERAQRAEATVRAFCEREKIAITGDMGAAGTTAAFRHETGVELNILPLRGRVADLIIAGRGPDAAHEQADLLGTLLLETGRPVLLSPAAPSVLAPGGTVAIAWKDAPQAAHAVAAARNFIESAGHVVILTLDEDDDGEDPAGERLAQALGWQAKKVGVVRLTPDGQLPGDALLAAAAQAGAGLLVMGGYGHTRLREAVFGGVTRRVLAHATLPVLMMH
jgi:nucleotide-binding universal stress UspA family protein